MRLSIVIPVFNEEKRIQKSFEALSNYLPKKGLESQVIFVNDGSTDSTAEILKSAKTKFDFETVSYETNRGKGYAIRVGMKKSAGDYVLLMDVDMSTPIEELDHFLPHLENDSVVIGTRKGKSSRVTLKQPYLRQKMGEIYTFLANILIVGHISDFTCGFKCFPKEAVTKISEVSMINRWSYDSEILFLAHKFGFNIEEIPVVWADDKRTRVKIARDALRSFIDLFVIRLNDVLGRYQSRIR